MPELPEVETTVRGIRPYLLGQEICDIVVRDRRLRWPIPHGLEEKVSGSKVIGVERRAKYILIHLNQGGLLAHLGMSGSFRVLDGLVKPQKHDHYDLKLNSGWIVRFKDPRRFGCLLYSDFCINDHPLLQTLGVEPLTAKFCGEGLYQISKKRNVPVKTLIMDGKVVVGVGNIYASEALFLAGIHPIRSCSRISRDRYIKLVEVIKTVLKQAITKGGTTLQDFSGAHGEPGYFEQKLLVYGRKDDGCVRCGTVIRSAMIAQRNTFYCPACQR